MLSVQRDLNDGYGGKGQPSQWIRGWNFTTDLYRILEHAVDCQRWRSSSNTDGRTGVWSLFRPAPMAAASVMDHVLSMYSSLPAQFRETPPVTGDPAQDIVGFQSANIQATLQLLRMVLFANEDPGADGKCDVAPLTGFEDPLTQFQLPPELLDDWPWSFDTSPPEGVFPMPFIK